MRVECIIPVMASRTKRTRVRKNKTKRRSFRRVKGGGEERNSKKRIDLSRGEASPEEIKGENDAKKELNDHDIFNKTHKYDQIIRDVNILMKAKMNENNSYSTEYMKGYMNKMEQIKRDYEKGRFTQVTYRPETI